MATFRIYIINLKDYCTTWNEEETMFTRSNQATYSLDKYYSDDYLMRPSDQYRKEISFDENHNELERYFVFPGVEILGQEKYSEIKGAFPWISMILNCLTVPCAGAQV